MKQPTPSAQILLEMFEKDPSKMETIKSSNDPLAELKKVTEEATKESDIQTKEYQAAFIGDKRIYRTAIGVLAALAIIAALGGVLLTFYEKTLPESVIALGSASVGALVGLFADKPTG